MAGKDRILQQIKAWREELINLSKRNRLLFFKHSKTSTLEIKMPASAAVISRLQTNRRNWQFFMPPDPELDPPRAPAEDELVTQKEDQQSLLATLKSLERRTAQEFMDKGLWVLYLGVGILRWVDPEEQSVAESPLWLVPIVIRRETPREPFRMSLAEEDAVLNPALVVKLANDFGIELPKQEDIDEGDPLAVLDRVRSAVASRRDWSVEDRLIVSTFSFHKEVMYRDLLDNEAVVAAHPLIEALSLGTDAETSFDFDEIPEDELDVKAPPEQMSTILDADASQRKCIVAARDGRSFVMDGPPGTGKSQTIANMVSELLSQGKTVLFVSEKAAALEVVHSRLAEAGLGDFLLELHSHKATRREVAQELGRALSFQTPPPRALSSGRLARLRERREELSRYALALNERREPLGQSLHDVLGRIVQLQDSPQAPPTTQRAASMTVERINSVVSVATRLSRAWRPVSEGDEFLWRDIKDTSWNAGRERELADILANAQAALEEFMQLGNAAADELSTAQPTTSVACDALRGLLELAAGRRTPPIDWLTTDGFPELQRRIETLAEEGRRWSRSVSQLEAKAGLAWRAMDEKAADVVRACREGLLDLRPNVKPRNDAPLSEWVQVRDLAMWLDATLRQITRDSSDIATRFELPEGRLDLARAKELAELGSLVEQPSKPQAEWLDPTVLPAVDLAVETLRALVGEFRAKEQELSEVFTDAILDLTDLKDIRVRFESVHRGARKLSKQYRQDKRAIAACARAGKASKGVVACLKQAEDWQALTARLRDAEKRHAAFIGAYYASTDTDFNILTAALDVAHRALQLAGDQLSTQALSRQLAGGADAETSLAARRLGTSIGEVSERLEASLARHLTRMQDMSIDEMVEWCERVSKLAEAAVSTFERAGAVVGADMSPEQMLGLLELRKEVHDIETGFAGSADADSRLIGPKYAGTSTDWGDVEGDLGWALDVRDLMAGALQLPTAQALMSTEMLPDALRSSRERWDKRRDAVTALFNSSRAAELSDDLDSNVDDARSLLADLSATISDVDVWAAFSESKSWLENAGCEPQLAFCVDGKIPALEVSRTLERSLLEGFADEILRTDERLSVTRAEDRSEIADEFRRLDREYVATAVSAVIDRCNGRRPRTNIGAPALIQKEAQKKSRHKPIRLLMKEAGSVIQDLKPCFMMSPLTVSQFLPPDLRFDVVIFDEASQVPPSDAVNCIYRSAELIVAGDQKQLPPTSFFERVSLDGGDQYQEDELEDFESILDLCKGNVGLKSLSLRWHYRSQHEALITFSNYSFYDGTLVTFPGAAQEAPDVGVALIQVSGVYRRGGPRDNPIEAEEVAKRVLYHARTHPKLSLGVVAFSEAQAGAIEDALDRLRKEAPELDAYFSEDRLHGFFVKNLENVQGDERDIIIFSVGYGRDEVGRFTMQFGPLNQAGGWRRLNVAITRARRRVELVSSVSAGDFEPDITNRGVRQLQRYLDYCARGMPALALELGETSRDAESPFEEEVIRVLRAWGYDAVPQVGSARYRIDIGVRHPSKPGAFVLGVECDGVMYHSSKVARDRDRLRQEILEGLGWRLHRIWGTAWYGSRRKAEELLLAALERAVRGEPEPPADESPTRPALPDPVEVELTTIPDWVHPYTVARVRPRTRLDMQDPSARSEVQRMINDVVEVEGPVHEEIVLRRVREAWGLNRTGHRVREAFSAALRALSWNVAFKVTKDRAGFLWRDEAEYTVRGPVEDDTETFRNVNEICVEELQLAMKWLCEEARSISRDELLFGVARIFGWARRGSDITPALERALAGLLREGTLRESGGTVALG